MEGKELQFNLDQEFQEAMQQVKQTGEAYQRALGKLEYLQSVAQRLNPPPEQEPDNNLPN